MMSAGGSGRSRIPNVTLSGVDYSPVPRRRSRFRRDAHRPAGRLYGPMHYQVAKSCVERQCCIFGLPATKVISRRADSIERHLKSAELRRGTDPDQDDLGLDGGDEQPRWSTSERVVEMIIHGCGSLWRGTALALAGYEMGERIKTMTGGFDWCGGYKTPVFASRSSWPMSFSSS